MRFISSPENCFQNSSLKCFKYENFATMYLSIWMFVAFVPYYKINLLY